MRPLVLFDLDNTLVDRRLAVTDWAAAFRARHHLDAESEVWVSDLLADRATPAHFAQVRNRFALAQTVDALWSGYCADLAGAVICPPEVLSGLDELRGSSWRIGVVTNGATDIQRAKLRATGIADRVDAICVSEEAGARKPDPIVFREAVRRCGGPQDGADVWMVGDNPVKDIAGGRAAGFRTVWIDHGIPWPEELPAPDHQVLNARAAIDLLTGIDTVGKLT